MDFLGFAEKLFAGRWIAGAGITDVLLYAQKLNSNRLEVMINYLGEAFGEKTDVEDAVSTYLQLISEIKKAKVRASISLKLTQLGYLIDKSYSYDNYLKIANAAVKAGIFTWLDMEESTYVDATLSLYKTRIKTRMTGICIQSYLRRSEKDITSLLDEGGVIRLVKGAYSESSKNAFISRDEITTNYLKLMKLLFKHADMFSIATHDSRIINKAISMNKEYKKNVSYVLLNGIRNRYALQLSNLGMDVSLYLPFGRRWVSYSYRRLKEASNVKLILRSLFENQELEMISK